MERIFTLEEARQTLRQIQPLTEVYVKLVGRLRRRLGSTESAGDASAAERSEAQIGEAVAEWMEQVNSHGALARKAWVVGFDSGDGYFYCWQYGEPDILCYHTYDTNPADRKPIGLLDRRSNSR